jgi:hypothetical protein
MGCCQYRIPFFAESRLLLALESQLFIMELEKARQEFGQVTVSCGSSFTLIRPLSLHPIKLVIL